MTTGTTVACTEAQASVGDWTDDRKSEVEGGASTRAELRGAQSTFVGGRQESLYSTYGFSTSRIAIGQQYQFFRNAWVHPFIGGGIDFTWESIDQFDQVFSSFPIPATGRVDHPDRSEFHTRPFATVGLKVVHDASWILQDRREVCRRQPRAR